MSEFKNFKMIPSGDRDIPDNTFDVSYVLLYTKDSLKTLVIHSLPVFPSLSCHNLNRIERCNEVLM